MSGMDDPMQTELLLDSSGKSGGTPGKGKCWDHLLFRENQEIVWLPICWAQP
jgi:hypothetical protein